MCFDIIHITLIEHILPHADDLMRHRKLLNPEFAPFLNLTIIVEGGKERMLSHRSIIEQRCPSLLLAVKYIKKKKEKKGITGPVSSISLSEQQYTREEQCVN